MDIFSGDPVKEPPPPTDTDNDPDESALLPDNVKPERPKYRWPH